VIASTLGEDAQIPNRKKASHPVRGPAADEANYYIGIYIGWRGESVHLGSRKQRPAFRGEFATMNAVLVSENTADDGVEQRILELSGAAKVTGERAIVLIGHSFGGPDRRTHLCRSVLRRLQDLPDSPLIAARVCLEPFADPASFSMNPADSQHRLAPTDG
jgi:hypothetical protein